MDARKIGSSNYSGVVDELSSRELRLRMESPCRQVSGERIPGRVEQEVAANRPPPTEDEDLRVEHRSKARARGPEPAAELPQRLESSGITRGDEFSDLVACHLAGDGAGLGDGE